MATPPSPSTTTTTPPSYTVMDLNPNMDKIKAQMEQQQKMTKFMTSAMSESCIGKSIFAGIAGGGFGVVWSLFSLGLSSSVAPELQPPGTVVQKQTIRQMMKEQGLKTWGTAKAFGGMGMVYSGFECTVEKYRGKHDIYNSLVGGCLAGGTLTIRSGPQAAAFGCAGFAAFSAVIDLVFNM